MTDPEDSVELMPADLAEVEVDVADEFERPLPLEADPADVVEQKLPVDDDSEDYPDV
ncbi:MAG: hypothetical protein QOF87_1348 [Pseudonocardiales bacterium]|nr:hypothetical protein [Pseudonocardiales bacterium]MDT4961701.1 hypothetical protein [Pseudonocardiales bacterium]